MAEYKVVNTTELDRDLKAVADSIKAKTGTNTPLTFPEGFCSAVESIETGNSAKEEQTKSLNVTTNGNYDILPDSGKVLSKVNVVVNVENSGGEGIDGLPTGYARADFIQFTEEQVIDTGIICNKNTTIKVVFTREKSSQHYLLGVSSSDNTASITAYLGGNWRFGNKAVTKSPTANEDMIYSAILGDTEIAITGSSTEISGVNEFETIGSLLLGTCRSDNGAVASPTYEGKIFFFTIWQGEEQVLKFVPVVSAEGQHRFFDMVSKTFFDSITDTPLNGGNL